MSNDPTMDDLDPQFRQTTLEPRLGRTGTYAPPNTTEPVLTGVAYLVDESALAMVTVGGSSSDNSRRGMLSVRQELVARPVQGGRFFDGVDEWTVVNLPRLLHGSWEMEVGWRRVVSAGVKRKA